MTKEEQLARILNILPNLSKGQIYWLCQLAQSYGNRAEYKLSATTLLNQQMMEDFGDALRTHHALSKDAFSKDKFEYVLERVINLNGGKAAMAGRGNPGHDITINGVACSLKSQANTGISRDKIWISKFHELGRGEWTDKPEQLVGLRAQFFKHMGSYDRIFTLRCLSKAPNWEYQLVEIPKELLMQAQNGELEMMMNSRQMPKPGCCWVRSGGQLLFYLYFDGGTERKLQIKDLLVSKCIVHASWRFFAPTQEEASELGLPAS
jgi:hypothetical protein